MQHRARLCRAICAVVPRLRGLFTDRGPTEEAYELERSQACSSGELIMLRITMCLWRDGRDAPRLDEVWGRLDEECVRRIAEILRLLALREDQQSIGLRWLELHDMDRGLTW